MNTAQLIVEGFLTEAAHVLTKNGSVVDLRWEMSPHPWKTAGWVGNWYNAYMTDNLYFDFGSSKFQLGNNIALERVSNIPENAVVLPEEFSELPIVMDQQNKVIYIGRLGVKNEEEQELYEKMAKDQSLVDALLTATA